MSLDPIAFAVAGTAAMFSATVQAPLTGVILAVEMTGRADLSLDLLATSLGAMVVTMLCRNRPIYESLRELLLAEKSATEAAVLAAKD